MRAVVNSVSAAVPAPAHQILGEMKCSFSQFLSATIGPDVARVSAAIFVGGVSLGVFVMVVLC